MTKETTQAYNVPDISCQHCVDAITKHVSAVANVQSLEVNLEKKLVTVVGGANDEIIEAIDEAGYDIETQGT
jgi:copper chaperone